MATSFKKLLLTSLLLSTSSLFATLSPTEKKRLKATELLELNKYTGKTHVNDNDFPMLKSQILFLFSKGEQDKGLKKYQEYYQKTNAHDFKLLREMALMIIEDGIAKGTEQDSLLSLIAMEIASEDCFTHLLGKLTHSRYFPVQAKTLSLLKRINNDYSDLLIKSCLTSDFIMLRLEALSILVQKHNKTALGQVEALMNMVHKAYHPIFVDFYALAGTKYAISVLKQMISDRDLNLNLAVIHAAKNYHIEELIPNLRSSLTHTSPLVQEIAAYALGTFHDSYSKEKLEALCSSKHEETKLASLFALYNIGEKDAKKGIISLAKNGNLYAISLLSKMEGCEKPLHEIYYNDNNDLRINSAIALLELKDPLCLPLIKDLITLDFNTKYLQVSHSPGKAFFNMKLLPLSSLDKNEMIMHAKQQTIMIQNSLLARSIDLPREKFMLIVDEIFKRKHNSLVPTAIALLENFDDEESINYLTKKSTMPGAPFIRASCHLSLWKSTKNEVHKKAISDWLKIHGKHKMISIAENKKDPTKNPTGLTSYDLSLEEKSHLLIQSFLNISQAHEKSGLDDILDAMQNGHKKNRIPLAGVLLKTIQ